MSQKLETLPAAIGIDIGKNSFHIVGRTNAGPSCCGRSSRVARWRPTRQFAEAFCGMRFKFSEP